MRIEQGFSKAFRTFRTIDRSVLRPDKNRQVIEDICKKIALQSNYVFPGKIEIITGVSRMSVDACGKSAFKVPAAFRRSDLCLAIARHIVLNNGGGATDLGWEYTRTLLVVVQIVMGPMARMFLVECYKSNGVKFKPPRMYERKTPWYR